MDSNFQYWTRRIIAWALTLCASGVLSYLAINGSEDAMTALVALTGTVIGFYFGTRQ